MSSPLANILDLTETDFKKVVVYAVKLEKKYESPHISKDDLLHELYLSIYECRRKKPLGGDNLRFALGALKSIANNIISKKSNMNHSNINDSILESENISPDREYDNNKMIRIVFDKLNSKKVDNITMSMAYLIFVKDIHEPKELSRLMGIDIKKVYNMKKKILNLLR